MPRGYRHIKKYENEILEMKSKGCTNREICERYGFEMKQIKNFINRFNTTQRKLAAGIAIKKKGRPAKDITMNVSKQKTKLTPLEKRSQYVA